MLDGEAVLQIVEKYQDLNFESITIERTTPKTINTIMNKCIEGKHFEERFEYYDDEDNTKRINWIDVEGETYGWLHLKNKENMPNLLRNRFKNYLEKINKEDMFVITIKTDSSLIIFHFIEREDYMQDRVYVISDSTIEY